MDGHVGDASLASPRRPTRHEGEATRSILKRRSIESAQFSGMDESQLPPINRAFLAVACERWPEFLPSASIQDFGELVIECPLQSPDAGPILWVSADDHLNEVVIGLAGGHSLGWTWDDSSAPTTPSKPRSNSSTRSWKREWSLADWATEAESDIAAERAHSCRR